MPLTRKNQFKKSPEQTVKENPTTETQEEQEDPKTEQEDKKTVVLEGREYKVSTKRGDGVVTGEVPKGTKSDE